VGSRRVPRRRSSCDIVNEGAVVAVLYEAAACGGSAMTPPSATTAATELPDYELFQWSGREECSRFAPPSEIPVGSRRVAVGVGMVVRHDDIRTGGKGLRFFLEQATSLDYPSSSAGWPSRSMTQLISDNAAGPRS